MSTNQVQTAPEIKLTYDDYKLLPDDGKRYEVIKGDLYVTPSPTTPHQRIVRALFRVLDDFVRKNDLGEVLFAPLDTIVSRHTVVQPDLIFLSHDRKAIAGNWVTGGPDLVVEVLSPTTQERDFFLKRYLYLKSGVEEYWIMDPDKMTIQIWRGDRSEMLRGGKVTLTDSVLGRLELDLQEVFSH